MIYLTLSQKYFLQRLVSSSLGESIPLLYPEGMLFPSIFWKMVENCGSIIGSLPSCLLAHTSSFHGFASVGDHIRSRLTLPGTATSSNQKYVAFSYDMLTNLTLNHQDTRIVLNRGLVMGDSGVQCRSRDDSSLLDSIDSKLMVKNLCASQKYHQMHFF